MSRVGKCITYVALVGVVVLIGVANTEVFKWTDANGKVHYSDRKMDSSAVNLNVTTGAASLGESEYGVAQRLMEQKKYLSYLASERLERRRKAC